MDVVYGKAALERIDCPKGLVEVLTCAQIISLGHSLNVMQMTGRRLE